MSFTYAKFNIRFIVQSIRSNIAGWLRSQFETLDITPTKSERENPYFFGMRMIAELFLPYGPRPYFSSEYKILLGKFETFMIVELNPKDRFKKIHIVECGVYGVKIGEKGWLRPRAEVSSQLKRAG